MQISENNSDNSEAELLDNEDHSQNKVNHGFPSNYSSLPIQELRMRAQKIGIKNYDTLDKILLIEEFIKLDQANQ